MRARFLKPAEAEVAEAIAFFDDRRVGLGDRFEEDLVATVNFLVEHPSAGKPIEKRVRRFSLRKFRYSVVYVSEEEEIVIVAVAHHRRRPGYWHSRLVLLR
jgi:plasmid stabilization system protein ParE